MPILIQALPRAGLFLIVKAAILASTAMLKCIHLIHHSIMDHFPTSVLPIRLGSNISESFLKDD
jgi:hypothetical protein